MNDSHINISCFYSLCFKWQNCPEFERSKDIHVIIISLVFTIAFCIDLFVLRCAISFKACVGVYILHVNILICLCVGRLACHACLLYVYLYADDVIKLS